MRKHLPIVATALVALTVGTIAGWLSHDDVEPEVYVQWKEKVVTKVEYVEVKTASFAASTHHVLPPTIKTKTIVKYVDGPTEGSCKVAEVVHEKEDTSPGGSITSNTSGNSSSKVNGSAQQDIQTQFKRDETRSAAPRLTLGLGAAISPIADERNVAPSVNLGVRVWDNYTIRAAADVPPLDLRETRINAWLELPL